MFLKYARVWGVWDLVNSSIVFVSVMRSHCVKFCGLSPSSSFRVVRFDISPLEV